MFKSIKLAVFAAALLLVVASSAFALDMKDLNQQMWTWSQLEAVLQESSHSNYPPVVEPQEAYRCIEEAKAKIVKIVAAIATADELSEARKKAAEFVSMGDFEKEVGIALNKLLDKQEKYLNAHREL